MSVTVWGTFCNSVPLYGLSFYCEGSPTCSVFEDFAAVTCQNQTSRLYCTNGHNCGSANFTNDIYITFSLSGLSATIYDTITRPTFSFNQTIPVQASGGSKTVRRKLEDQVSNELKPRFQSVFGETANPGHSLASSLATALFNSGSKTSSATQLLRDIIDSISLAIQTCTNSIVSHKQCTAEGAIEGELAAANSGSISGITTSIPQSTLRTWLLTLSISHIIANIALVSDVDVAEKILSQSTASVCYSGKIPTKTSSSLSSSTSKATTTSVKTPSRSAIKSTSTTTKTTSTTSKISSSSISKSTSATITAKTSSSSASKSTSTTVKTTTTIKTATTKPSSSSTSFAYRTTSACINLDTHLADKDLLFVSNFDTTNTTYFFYGSSDSSGNTQTITDKLALTTSGDILDFDVSNLETELTIISPNGSFVQIPANNNTNSILYGLNSNLGSIFSSTSSSNTEITAGAYSASCGYNSISQLHQNCLTYVSDANDVPNKYCAVQGVTLAALATLCAFGTTLTEGGLALLCTPIFAAVTAPVGITCAIVGVGSVLEPDIICPINQFSGVLLSASVSGIPGAGTVSFPPTPIANSPSFITSLTVPATTACSTPAVYADQTENCSPFQAFGNAVYCCTGACIDGTSIGKPGQCESWSDVCGDVDDWAPLCGETQVLNGGNGIYAVPSGNGGCWFGDDCVWSKNNWTWSCCDCPSGYQNVFLDACEGSGRVSGPCVGCSDPTDTLSGNAASGFTCTQAK